MAAGDMIFYFSGAGTWTVPTGVTAIKVECFGYADLVVNFFSTPIQTNLPGASYSQTSSLSVTAGSTIYIGTTSGNNSRWVNKTSDAAPTSTADGCLAVGGIIAAASQVAANVGDIKYAGGNGVVSTGSNLSGRGGQAGPNGSGADAGSAYSATGITVNSGPWFPRNGGGANGGISGGLGSIPYGRSSGAFGGNGGYWTGSAYVDPTQDVIGQAQYVNGYPLTTPLNYGPSGGAACVVSDDDGFFDRFDVAGQSGFIVITVVATTQKSIVFAGSQSGSFTLPSDFASLVSMRAFGAAGINSGGTTTTNGGGGGGGGYSETVGASVTAPMVAGSTLVYYNVPALAAGSSASSWINIGTNSAPSAVTSGALAFSGGNTSLNTGGIGGPTASAVGDTKNAGGAGGTGYISTRRNGGGGGGAAGPSGAGATGGSGFTTANRGGGGGGAANGGSAGSAGTNIAGGAGGSITGGSAGAGATASSGATAGTNGGGSGGGFATTFGATQKGSILSFENGLYYINGGTGGNGGQTGVANSGGQGGAGFRVSNNGAFNYGEGLVVFTYVPAANVSVSVNVVGVSSTGSVGSLTVSGKSRFTPTGMASTGSVGSITVEAKAQILLTGSASSAVLGSAVAKANAIVSVTGISATSALGTVTTQITELSPIISITGFQATGSVGSLTLIGKANTSIIGQGIISSLGIVEVKAKSVCVTTGVLATGNIGNVTITNVVFDFNAVAALYDRNRTVFVEAKSTTKERTALVMKDNRVVYIEGRSSSYDRSVLVE